MITIFVNFQNCTLYPENHISKDYQFRFNFTQAQFNYYIKSTFNTKFALYF